MGDKPRGPCRYMMTRNSTAKLARPWNSEASRDAVIVGTRKIDNGSIGSGWRLSIIPNAPLDAEMVGYLVGGVALIVVFVVIEARVAEPMLLNVRIMPDAYGIASGGAAFMIAALLAGKKKLAPMPLMMLASTTTHSPVVLLSWA